MQISAILSVRGNEVKPLQLEASVDGPPLPSPRSVPLTNTDTHTGTNTPLYHSAIFPAPSCFSECTLTDIKTLMHTHEKKKQLFSDLFSMYKSQIVREMVSLGALGSHTSRPAKQENANGGFYLSFLRWSLCVCRYFHFICTHTLWITLRANQRLQHRWGVECRWLTCLHMNHMTAYLNRSRPLIPETWFGHSDPNTML